MGRGLADKAFKGAGEVGLIGITGQVNGVEDRDPLTQEYGGLACPFNLADGALGQARGM